MSTFETPTYFFLFEMKNGKQKLAYGADKEDALAILRMRLSPEEMDEILVDQCQKVQQRKMRDHISNLG